MKIPWTFMTIIIIKCSHSFMLNNLEVITRIGNYSAPNILELNALVEYVLIFEPTNSLKPYRIKAWSAKATIDYPVLIVVKQEKQVTSWQVPLLVDTSKKDTKIQFRNTSRTMCHDKMDQIVSNSSINSGALKLTQSFIISISTSSGKKVDIVVSVEPEEDFYAVPDTEYSMSVSPSQPRYIYYRFNPNATDTTIIEVDSEDDVCLTISVQDSSCPVMDLNKDITFEGKYQTINRKGAIIVRKREYMLGFFLVFVAKPDNFYCSQENSFLPIPRNIVITQINRTSIVSFKINNSINKHDYFIACVVIASALALFCILAIVLVILFTRFGNLKECRKDGCDLVADPDNVDNTHPPSAEETGYMLRNKILYVKQLAKYPNKDKRRSYNYLWHIMNIAIFYSIPVVQLVITYQRVVNQTGNQDLCYYNFRCAHPAAGLSDFNHIYSNIGYVATGLLFICVVLFRQRRVPFRFEIGIPVHYGLFYAMGVALIIEGLLSACYHICPSQSNYQFDTSFMYVMAVLCMVKLYQNRHPDINATAYATFSVLGLAIFLAMVGILNGSLAVWIFFVVIYSLLCIYISFKIYFLSYILEGCQQIKTDLQEGLRGKAFQPIKTGRFILLLIANILNLAMLVTGLCLYDSGVTDFGTFLLGLLMANGILHATFYTAMKLIHHERICGEAVCYGLLAVASWGTATFFFLDAATLWTVTPAESRQWNQDCILLDFFDKHDVWHLLSAPALYFTFMYLLSLDDDIINEKQDKIPIF